jgi:hypothetical protein
LRLETTGGCKAVFLWNPKIMEKRPQDVVTVTIIILMNQLLIKKYWDAPLQSIKQLGRERQYIIYLCIGGMGAKLTHHRHYPRL